MTWICIKLNVEHFFHTFLCHLSTFLGEESVSLFIQETLAVMVDFFQYSTNTGLLSSNVPCPWCEVHCHANCCSSIWDLPFFLWVLWRFFSLHLGISSLTMPGVFLFMLLGAHRDSWTFALVFSTALVTFGHCFFLHFLFCSLCGHFFWVSNYIWYRPSGPWDSVLVPHTQSSFSLSSSDRITSISKSSALSPVSSILSGSLLMNLLMLVTVCFSPRISLFYTFYFSSGTSYLLIHFFLKL